MLKFLTLILIGVFAWWRLSRWWQVRRLRAQGLPVPEEKGLRAISVLALVLLAVYGGFLVWHLFVI